MPHLRLYRFHAVLIVKLATTMLWRLTVTSVTTSFQHFFRLPSGLENSMAKVMRRCMASSRSNGRFVAKMIIPGSTATEQGHTHALRARSRGLPRLPKSPQSATLGLFQASCEARTSKDRGAIVPFKLRQQHVNLTDFPTLLLPTAATKIDR